MKPRECVVLSFYTSTKRTLWFLNKDSKFNSLEKRFSTEQLFPDFCVRQSFFVCLIVERMKTAGSDKMVDVKKVLEWLIGQGVPEKSGRTVRKAV